MMSHTQLFMEYFGKLKHPVSITESNKQAALFIADWLSFRWRHSGTERLQNEEEYDHVVGTH